MSSERSSPKPFASRRSARITRSAVPPVRADGRDAGRWLVVSQDRLEARHLLLRWTGGRVGFGFVLPTAVLETRGAHSGFPGVTPSSISTMANG
jgi:hypothetical protein